MQSTKTNLNKAFVQKLFAHGGIEVNGSNPWDVTVHDERLYPRLISGGSLGLGEGYMNGWWTSPKPDEFITRIIRAELGKKVTIGTETIFNYVAAVLSDRGSKKRAFEIGKKHYDAGNDLFRMMLDKRLVYTCAYWKDATNLDDAQEAKLDLVCRKINLQPGQRILDIGCGWGSFAKFAAEKYGAHVVGITVSKEQVALAQELCKGLPVEIRLQDYRDVNEKFDHIISIGMFEHVGIKNYRTYMEMAHRCLNDDGLFLLHSIGGNISTVHNDLWIEKYIFPGGVLPSIAQIGKSIENLFVMEDWHNFGPHYDKTLMAWHSNFEKSWPQIKDSYDERFFRMWKYYLLSCAASFRAREIQLWQVVLSKRGVVGGYTSVR